jgi:hypothetical protein
MIGATRGRALLVLLAAGACLGAGPGCSGEKTCNDATGALKMSIDAVCDEPAFVSTPFCQCCRPKGFYSIDDTCTCQPLVFDSDFCFYDSTPSGYPAIRNALVHASSVCLNRSITVTGGGDAATAPICQAGSTGDASVPDGD